MTRALLLRGAGFTALWWILAEGRLGGWWLGLLAILLALGASAWLLPLGRRRFSLRGLAGFVAYFVVHSARAGAQVAGMAFRPRLGLCPVVVDLTLDLPPGAPRLLLTAAVGLQPGTVGVKLRGARLRLHVLDVGLFAEADVRALERHVARLFAGAR
jgi:multicomponent Na+:H+ antiporter subunit E